MQPFWTQFISDYGARAQSTATAPGERSRWGSVIAPQLADPALAESIVATLDLTSANEDPARISAWGAKLTAGQGGWDWRDDARNVTAPVLTVHGVCDNIPVAASQEWARSFPNGRLLLIDGAGHYPHFERPDVFTDALFTFFSGEWPATAATG
jgi:pimeloyl-ACP methyl ester carboxylesterase